MASPRTDLEGGWLLPRATLEQGPEPSRGTFDVGGLVSTPQVGILTKQTVPTPRARPEEPGLRHADRNSGTTAPDKPSGNPVSSAYHLHLKHMAS